MPLPSSELVAAAWIGALPGFTPSMVATSLPKDSAAWAGGFITVTPAGGSPAVDVPTRWSLVQVDAWKASTDSGKPPWGEASNLAERIINACWVNTNQQKNVTVRPGYNVARLFSVWAASDPVRIWDDPSSYARWRFDLRMTWTTLAAVA